MDQPPLIQSARLEDYSPEFWAATAGKGAAVLNMLRGVMGDDNFMKLLHAIPDKFAFGNPSPPTISASSPRRSRAKSWAGSSPNGSNRAAAFGTSSIQRSAEQQAFDRVQHSEQLLGAWLDRTNALRGFLQTGAPAAFTAFNRLDVPFQAALQTERRDVRGVVVARALLASEVQDARRWQTLALIAAADIRDHGVRPLPLAATAPRSAASVAFQTASQRYTAVMETRRKSDIQSASETANVIVVLAALILAIAALAVTRASRRQEKRLTQGRLLEEQSRAAREHDYVEARARFSQVMLAADTEEEACQLVKSAIEALVSGSSVVVFRRNNSANRLEPVTGVAPASTLTGALEGGSARSCLAIRLGRAHTSDPAERSPAGCEVCGQQGACTTCEPLVVAGELMGSALISHPRPLTSHEQRAIDDTIALGTPVLANLRNLALAERRAHTDSLTGLPNRRALDDMLKLMLAQATRADEPLSLALVDVDGFKDVNDTFGHERGDELLSSFAGALARSLRASDFAARLGGDEFVVLLPGTDLDGARNVAEKMLAATHQTRLLGFNCEVSASFGIATFPGHGGDPAALMKSADGALYRAKSDGRNCVRLAAAHQREIGAAP